jgi:hypothetical protein
MLVRGLKSRRNIREKPYSYFAEAGFKGNNRADPHGASMIYKNPQVLLRYYKKLVCVSNCCRNKKIVIS